jgi:IS1 family transposase
MAMGMNKLPRDKRIQIISLMTDGMSLRAIMRATGVSINTVTKLLVDAGQACSDYQDKTFRNLRCKRVQGRWGLELHLRQSPERRRRQGRAGESRDIWTWTAIDADSKLIPSWYVGDRDADAARVFIGDLASRLANHVQLTSDGHKAYLQAVEEAFPWGIDYGQLIKLYGEAPIPAGRYSPGICTGIKKNDRIGKPDRSQMSTSYVERSNLTLRMNTRRFTRLTNAFSKKAENDAYAVGLHLMAYNFVRIHGTLKCSPAMAAGVTTKLWEIADVVTMIEEWENSQAAGSNWDTAQHGGLNAGSFPGPVVI